MSERDPWLTEREAAKELRVSAYTVRLEREAGRLGFAKLRSRFFYPMSHIEAYRQSLICPAKSNSGNTQGRADTISPGLSGPDHSAVQRAREISERLNKSSRPSSSSKVVALPPNQTRSA